MSRLSLSIYLCLIYATTAWAQKARGSLVGRVVDSSGASIQGAAVVVTSKTMGTTQKVVTNETGFYQASYLIPGAYSVEVSVSGFSRFVQDPV